MNYRSHEIAPRSGEGFLEKVPLEIRIQIYGYALVSEYGIRPYVDAFQWFGELLDEQIQESKERAKNIHRQTITPWADNVNLTRVRKELKIGITRTCRQICAESVPIYFAKNTFSFENVYYMAIFLCTISQERRAYIQHIDLMLNHTTTPSQLKCSDIVTHSFAFSKAFQHLAECKALSRLQIGVHKGTMDVLDDQTSQERRHYIRLHNPIRELSLKYSAAGWRNRRDLCRLILLGQYTSMFDCFRGFNDLEIRVREFKNQIEWDCPVPSTPNIDIEAYRDEIRKWRREGRQERFDQEPCKQAGWRAQYSSSNIKRFEALLRMELVKVTECTEKQEAQKVQQALASANTQSLPFRVAGGP